MAVPSAIICFLLIGGFWEPEFSKMTWFAIRHDELFGESGWFQWIQTQMLDEWMAVFCIMGLVFVAFSKRKLEDERVTHLRLTSLLWATYLTYALLIVITLFVFGMPFLWVLIINMIALLVVFIARFEFVLYKTNRAHEE
jgi:amino acid transporter